MKQVRKFSMFIIFLHLAFSNLNGQNLFPYTDSLVHLYENTLVDSIKIDALRSIIWKNLSYNPSFSLEYSKKMREHALSENDLFSIAKSDQYDGIAYRFLGDYKKSIVLLQNSVEYFRSTNDTLHLTNPLFQLGVSYSLDGQFDNSIDVYYEQLDIATSKNDTISLGSCHNSIGILFKNLQDYEKAKFHYKKASDYLNMTPKGISDLAMTYSNMSNVYILTNSLDSALHYNELSTGLEKKLNRISGLAFNFDQRSDIFQELKIQDSVLLYLSKSNKIYTELDDQVGLGNNFISLSRFHNKLDQFVEAEKNATEAVRITSKVGSWTHRNEALKYLIEAQKGLGKYQEAFQIQNIWIDNLDSLRTDANMKALQELSLKYETAEKDLKIIESNLALKTRTYQRNRLIAFCLAIASTAFFIFLYQRQKIAKNEEVSLKQNEISKQRILQLEKEQKINYMSSMIEGQESERIRIAKDLHDGLGGLLATVRTKMGQIQKQVNDISNLKLHQSTNKMIDQACDEVRRITHNLLPSILRIEGLKGALEDISDQLLQVRDIKIEVTLKFNSDLLSETQSYMIYRIVQESFNNIKKHSQATEVFFQAIEFSDHLNIVIEDNGVGFDISKKTNGIGLLSIKSRVNYLEGDYDFFSNEKGTSLSINIPISKESKKT